MDKNTAIELCKELMSDGLNAIPQYNRFHNDWEIRLNSTSYNRDIDRFCRMYDLVFIDFTFSRWEGVNNTQDFPIFFRRAVIK